LRQIRRLFDVTPISSYGSTETGHVFTQCEHGLFHENTATCHVDLQPLSRPAVVEGIGRILVTTLRNDWFSLVRFDVADLARLSAAPCRCGRKAGLTVASIEGRVRDVTFTTEGHVVTVNYLDRALGEAPGLLAYQIEQLTPTDYLMRFVAETGMESRASEFCVRALRHVYGAGAAITTQRETAIVPEPSGKYCLSRTRFAWDPGSLFT
jgi:phenylacetate-CoA ligase